MKKLLIASTALASVAVVAPSYAAEFDIKGSVEWRYTSVDNDAALAGRTRTFRGSDNTTATRDNATSGANNNYSNDLYEGNTVLSDTSFIGTHDVTISLTETTDNGLTLGLSMNIGEDGVGTTVSSISGDFGRVEYTEGDGGAHAASSYDVTSGGVAGGHGDGGFTVYDAYGVAVTGADAPILLGHDEAQIADGENGALNYHSPSFSGLSFGVGVSHLTHGDADTSLSYGAMYSGSAMGANFKVGAAAYDGQNEEESSHVGIEVSMDAFTIGAAAAKHSNGTRVESLDNATVANEEEVQSISATYAASDALKLNVGYATAENGVHELINSTFSVGYMIAPGLNFSLSMHNFEYTNGGQGNASLDSEGSAIQSELKMSF